MIRKIEKKWLAVGLIWTAAAALTAWNTHMVNQVESRREKLETLKMDMGFVRSNQSGIREVFQQKARLTHPVPSFSLGFVVVENDLKRLSRQFDLKQLQVTADTHAVVGGPAAISIFATGRVPAIVGWIAAVEEAYPHLVVDKMAIAYDRHERICQLQATFNYHFRLNDAEQTG
ncbi:MAG: hypothetical protein CR984_07200 [Proteobacteria bacterium]|nr:MAG: hypothetical protein CR984_07200 [Pseudomonadota bacterium]